VAVYAVEDVELGERVKAVIVPRTGASLTENSIRDFAKMPTTHSFSTKARTQRGEFHA